MRRAHTTVALLASLACAAPPPVPALASARMATDFETYTIRRVGLLPPQGLASVPDQAAELQAAFLAEFSAGTPYEVVSLGARDLDAIPSLDPYRRGEFAPATLLALAERFSLDALWIPTITDLQTHPPQRLGLSIELVSTETGQTIWSSSLQLDAARDSVRKSMRAWVEREVGDVSDTTWELTLISPRRFARFAAYQIATLI